MARKTALVLEDHLWARHEIKALLARLESRQNGTGLKALATQEFVGLVQAREADGDSQAARVAKALMTDGAWELVTVVNSEDRSLIGWNGSQVSIPARIGIRARRKDGTQGRHHQQRLWWEVSWVEFEDYLASEATHAERRARNVAALRAISALREKFPESQTPGEACERQGIDPRDLDLDVSI